MQQHDEEIRGEAWRRFQLVYPDGTAEAFERAWPALCAGILIERKRRAEVEQPAAAA